MFSTRTVFAVLVFQKVINNNNRYTRTIFIIIGELMLGGGREKGLSSNCISGLWNPKYVPDRRINWHKPNNSLIRMTYSAVKQYWHKNPIYIFDLRARRRSNCRHLVRFWNTSADSTRRYIDVTLDDLRCRFNFVFC